jgi:hypothetical protein
MRGHFGVEPLNLLVDSQSHFTFLLFLFSTPILQPFLFLSLAFSIFAITFSLVNYFYFCIWFLLYSLSLFFRLVLCFSPLLFAALFILALFLFYPNNSVCFQLIFLRL